MSQAWEKPRDDGADAPAKSPPTDSPATLRDAAAVFVQYGSPRVLLAAAAITFSARVAVGGWSAWDLAPVAIILALWPLQEWLIHVFVLHARPRKIGPWTFEVNTSSGNASIFSLINSPAIIRSLLWF